MTVSSSYTGLQAPQFAAYPNSLNLLFVVLSLMLLLSSWIGWSFASCPFLVTNFFLPSIIASSSLQSSLRPLTICSPLFFITHCNLHFLFRFSSHLFCSWKTYFSPVHTNLWCCYCTVCISYPLVICFEQCQLALPLFLSGSRNTAYDSTCLFVSQIGMIRTFAEPHHKS